MGSEHASIRAVHGQRTGAAAGSDEAVGRTDGTEATAGIRSYALVDAPPAPRVPGLALCVCAYVSLGCCWWPADGGRRVCEAHGATTG